MTSDATLPPGSLTVPPLFGWESLVVGLVLAVLIGVAYLVLSAMSDSGRASADWDEWLQGRSRGRGEGAPEPARPRHAAAPSPGTADESSGAPGSR